MFSISRYYCRHKTNRDAAPPPKLQFVLLMQMFSPSEKSPTPLGGFFYCPAGNIREALRYHFCGAIAAGREEMLIRNATLDDLNAVAAVEAQCFPEAEAATAVEFEDRIRHYGNHFWLMFDGELLVSFVDGFVTDEPDLTDVMYEKADMHNEDGKWQMIFGVNTIPSYRHRGLAGQLIRRAVQDARAEGRRGLVLTCKERLVPYYAKFGFVSEGVTEKSSHGGVTWYQMRLTF